MNKSIISLVLTHLCLIISCSVVAYYLGRFKIARQSQLFGYKPKSLMHFYGLAISLWTFVMGCTVFVISKCIVTEQQLWFVWVGCSCLITMTFGLFVMSPHFHARGYLEKIVVRSLMAAAGLAILITISIFTILFIESLHFFSMVPVTEFLFGLHWNPPTLLEVSINDIVGHYGVIPLLTGTLLITIIAMLIAVPLGLFVAIFTAEYASARQRRIIKPIVEILAGVPTIVYGFFALIAVAPLLHSLGKLIQLPIASESALGAGLVMGIMITPFISSLSDEALSSIPRSLRENSWALGATPSETIRKVTIPAALPGIASAILLAFSRAIGETMLVVMATGLTAHLTLNPFNSVTSITVQIVALLTGDQEFNSPKTLAAFALGLLLFLCTLVLNIVALRIVHWHREKYAV